VPAPRRDCSAARPGIRVVHVTGEPPNESHVQTLLILGAAGDLTARLLLPGLGTLLAEKEASDLLLVGSGRGGWDDEQWRDLVARSFASAGASGPAVDAELQSRWTTTRRTPGPAGL
jgi:glucose-6-phosphate 1-dehydrogenase